MVCLLLVCLRLHGYSACRCFALFACLLAWYSGYCLFDGFLGLILGFWLWFFDCVVWCFVVRCGVFSLGVLIVSSASCLFLWRIAGICLSRFGV